ncbi:MAG: aminotransferase [Melioribacteraceae bacterium]|nr:MAG: aminotransferase [Melioribacteraceae bacterium]
MTVKEVRELFPHIASGKIYFNHASIGPLSVNVSNAVKAYADERSSGKIKNYDDFLVIEEETKKLLPGILGCKPQNIAWIDNVSNAMNLLARGIEFKPGDEILLSDIEFPSNVYPFLNLQQNGVKVNFVKSEQGKLPFESIIKCVTKKTKLLSISYVQFVSGWRTDIKKLGEFCKKNDIIFSVDGIQGAGTLFPDLDNTYVDFFTGGSQKWLMALQGLSYFYISDRLLERLKQTSLGWLSVKTAWELLNYDMELKPDASRFQTGTQNALGIFALNASLKTFNEFGIHNIERNILENTLYFISKLNRIGVNPLLSDCNVENLSGIVTFPFPNPEENLEKLKSSNIYGELREGYLRFSPHFYNTKEEIDIVVKALSGLT